MGINESAHFRSALASSLDLGSGALLGVLKDNFDVAGQTTTMGSQAFADESPALAHADVVNRLIAGGCRIVGRAKMHELAFGVSGINLWQGTPVNPLFPDLIPGGSSSGSAAAVASGSVDFALGTDTGGSIREPAACCGVIGFKPTFGRVSHVGVHPSHSSLDCVGVFARAVAVIEQVAAIIDPQFMRAPDTGDITLGLVKIDTDDDISDAFSLAIAQIGLKTVVVSLPSMEDAFGAGMTIIGAEMWQSFGGDSERLDKMGADIAGRLRAAAKITARDVAMAEAVRDRFTAEVNQALESVGVLALPTLPQVPPTLIEARDGRNLLRLTQNVRPFNLSGHPAISLPIATAKGLPAGLQLVGRKNQDAHLCAVARQIEAELSQNERQAA
jgi:amidase